MHRLREPRKRNLHYCFAYSKSSTQILLPLLSHYFTSTNMHSQQHPFHLLLKNYPTNRRAVQQVHSQLIVTALHHHRYMLLWNTLIQHYSLGVFPQEALQLYNYRQYIHSSFDSFTYSFLFKTCSNLQQPCIGFQLHSLTMKLGFQTHVYVQTSLLNMYAVCGFLCEAKQVFVEMPGRNSVTWNALITGYTKWAKLNLAQSLFNEMPNPNVVSWTALIDGYTRTNRPSEAMALFHKMLVMEGIKPNEITILTIFPAVSKIGSPELCQSIHTYIEKNGFNASDIRITNSLIDSYAKIGCIKSALLVFEEISISRRNLVSWTSIISGFAMHGMAKEAVESFQMMENQSLTPNQVTFLSLLNACSHGGLVDEGLMFFTKMVNECGISPGIKHYGCLIDMLGRAGRLEEAEKTALKIPFENANVVIWRTLLGACSFHNNVEISERVMTKILEMERRYGGDYVLLSNVFTGAGRFADAERVRRLMDDRNASKVPGNCLL